ncbi:FAD-dependent oxidoreductase [Streptomyces sp. NPDC002073]|uniref:FAD-dependent oxidoreductase n=1 Tax=Streptomyces sp. NBC_00239 TaxID=2903640 RepID=UPI002E2DD0AA|nr:FAD-dependent oxidoreductase [Streptomyces sp. NBC_00239]
MLSSAHHADVVIVGAGVSGLSAAHHLISSGITVTVLEAGPASGGRMATDEIDGFLLDRTGHLLTTSSPELGRTAALADLRLRTFAPGVLVQSEGRRLVVTPPGSRGRVGPGARTAARALASRSLDQARLSAALGRLAATPEDRLLARPDRTAAAALPRTFHGVLRPLLTSLLGDPELTTSRRCADLALRAFALGRLAVPEGGAAQLPALLAAGLPPGTVHTGVRVRSVSTSAVTTEEHGVFRCRSVLLATGARAAADLLPGLRVPDFHPVTVLHHTAPSAPALDTALLIDGDRRGPVAHTAVMSAVDPSRAPRGRTLITSTVLGAEPSEREVRAQLGALYGASTADWELLAVHHTPEAVPAMPPPQEVHRRVRVLAGLYVCGDHRDLNTVQGALHSARRASHAVLRDLGVPAVPPRLAVPAAA